jgi:excisionase family DNA binding protein
MIPHLAKLVKPNVNEEEQKNMEALLTIERAAETLGISPWTVRKYVANDKLRPVRIGRRVLIEPEEIRRIIEEGRSAGDTRTHKAARV